MIRSKPCSCQNGLAALPAPAGVGAVTLPIVGSIETKWLVIAAAALALFIYLRRRGSAHKAKRIVQRVTEF